MASERDGRALREEEDAAVVEAAGGKPILYGVGSALLRGSDDFTADVVEFDGRPAPRRAAAPIGSFRPRPPG